MQNLRRYQTVCYIYSRENKGLDVWQWQEIVSTNTTTDVIVPPSLKDEMNLKLNGANISYVVEIADLQSVIDKENPNGNSSSFVSKAGKNPIFTMLH